MQRKTLFIRLDEENKPLKEAKKEQSRSQEESQMWVRQVLGGGNEVTRCKAGGRSGEEKHVPWTQHLLHMSVILRPL